MRNFYIIFPLFLIIAAALSLWIFISKGWQSTPAQQIFILEGLEKEINIDSQINYYKYTDWLSSKSEQLPLEGRNFWAGTSNIKDEVEKNRIGDNIVLIDSTFLQKYIKRVENYFAKNGFRQNNKNTFTFKKDVSAQHRLGFERGEMKCVVTLYETTDPFGNFSCGKIDKKQLALQQQFIPPFSNTYSTVDPISFRVDKVEGNFALGNASEPILGYVWIAKKMEGGWKIVWRGEELPLCSEMKEFDIPDKIYGSCYPNPN